MERSFSLRMSLSILIVIFSVFVFVFGIYFEEARESVNEYAVEQAYAKLDNTVLQIDKVLFSVETAVKNISWVVEDNLDSPNHMYELTKQIVAANPYIVGSAIAFEPNYFPSKGRLYAPYSYRKDNEICNKQLGTKDYEYHNMEWYMSPKQQGKSYWSEPYGDYGGSDLVLTTYSMPLFDKEGVMYAVLTADISIEKFDKAVSDIKLYPNSRNFMIGRSGTFLINNRKETILKENFFAHLKQEEKEVLPDIGVRMRNGESGMASLTFDDKEYYLFYAPVKTTGWSICVVCPYNEVFARINGLRNSVLVVFVSGLLLISAFCYLTIRRLTKPLEQFANSANEIANGNFDFVLPDIENKDELKTLHNSFLSMQESLVRYIDELKVATAKKERIDSELRIARNIQMGMIPKVFLPFPNREDVDLYAQLIPAKEVGGDLYDFFLRESKLYFIIGDVSGKGVPASLFMAVICRLFRVVSLHMETPAEIVMALNNVLAESNETNMFCTFFIGVLNLDNGYLLYCNAGHNAPLVRNSQGEIKRLDIETNLPLGLYTDFPYVGQQCYIAKGSSLFLYTDGVTEAENKDKVLFSDQRLMNLLQTKHDHHPRTIVEAVLNDLSMFVDGAEQSDDITVLCVQYK